METTVTDDVYADDVLIAMFEQSKIISEQVYDLSTMMLIALCCLIMITGVAMVMLGYMITKS